MIVASLLLITVAVTLLVVGLAAGSSTLLIASIGTSLLAAVALVIGARQASGRAGPTGSARTPLAVDLDDDPGPATGPGENGRFAPVDPAGAYVPAGAGSTAGVRSAAFDETVVGLDPDPSVPDPSVPDPSPSARQPPEPVHPEGPRQEGPHPETTRSDSGRPGAVPDESADTEILDRVPDDGAAPAAGDPYADFHRQQAAAAHRGDVGAEQDRQAGDRDDPATRGAARDAGARDVVPGDRDAAFDIAGVQAHGEQPSDPDATDEEDPADEPAPQRTQPADAVRVSRMVAEVLVVDGRPRYHLGDCPSLSGRITEPLPVAEAVELGFTPCSMCRPVDRLVAEAVPR